MTPQQTVFIANTKNLLDGLQNINKTFLEHASMHSTPPDVPAKLEIEGQHISVPFFGYTADANARIVRFGNGLFAMEYVFFVKVEGRGEDLFQEVWRFYLLEGGRICETLISETPLCVCNNMHVAKILCGNLILGALKSPLFAANARQV
jgi:hypothetical protein